MRLVRYTYPSFPAFAPAFRAARSPWSGLDSETDRLFETAFAGLEGAASRSRFPVDLYVDLYEDKDNVYVRAELPGVSRDEINVEVADGELTLSATRQAQPAPANADANAAADPAQPEAAVAGDSFALTRTVSLTDEVQADKVTAAYENGVLTVTLPKREEAKPRKVTVAVK